MLGLFVLLLCIVLLVPIRYRIWGKKDETADARVQVHWLLHLVSVLLVVEQGKVTVGKVRICGFTLVNFLSDKESPETAQGEETADSLQNVSEQAGSVSEIQSEAEESTGTETGAVQSSTEEEPVGKPVQTGKKKKKTARKRKKAKAGRKPFLEYLSDEFAGFCSFINTVLERLEEGIDAFWDKVSPVLDTISVYYGFAAEDTTIRLIKRVLATVVDFVKYILPVKIQGSLHLGMADPAGTGQICSMMAILMPWYGQHFTFTPDFEKQVAEGEISCRGRIRLGHFVWKMLRLVCCRDFWQVIREWRKISAKKQVKNV